MPKKKFLVIIRIEKEVKRTVWAKGETNAAAIVKRKIASKPVNVTTRNFETFPTIIEL